MKSKGLLSTPFNLLVLVILLLFYAISDMQNSTVTYNQNSNRTSVYFFLICIICFLLVNVFLYLLSTHFKYRSSSILRSLFLIAVWLTVVNMLRGAPIWTALTHLGLCSLWILGYIFFQYLFEYRYKDINSIGTGFYLIFFLYSIAILYYFYDVQIRKGRIPVLNLIYNVIVLIPWLFVLFKNNQRRKICIAILSLVMAVLSLKRGGLIVLPLMLVSYLLIEARKENRLRSTLKMILVLGIAFVFAIIVINHFTNGFLIARFSAEQLEGGSGRINIYTAALENIQNRGIVDLILGLGSGSSSRIIGTGCHNEWLEFMFSFGIVGLALYFRMILTILLTIQKMKYMNPDYYAPSVMMCMYMVVIGMIGGIYFVHSSFFVFSFWGGAKGYLAGQRYYENREEGLYCRVQREK